MEDPKPEDKHETSVHTEHAEHAEHAEHQHHEAHAEHHEAHHGKKKIGLGSKTLMIILSIVFLAVLVANAYVMGVFHMAPAAQKEENQSPAQLQLLTITATNCSLCFDISPFGPALNNIAGMNVTGQRTIDASTPEAQSLISKYSITRLPSVIVTGQINDSRVVTVLSTVGEVKGDAFVVTQVPPPYFDLATSRVVGVVNYTAITDSSCTTCSNVSDVISSFKTANVVFGANNTLDSSWQQAKTLLAKYNITKLPAVIFSSDISVYNTINQSWSTIGSVASDGAYVLTSVPPPFKDLTTGVVSGVVNVTYLTDSNCTSCYNVSINHDILVNSFRMSIGSETTYDLSSAQGKALVSKYNITAVPTFILSSDAKYYSGLMTTWPSVGTNETDGSYVFRNIAALGNVTYFNISSGNQVVASGGS